MKIDLILTQSPAFTEYLRECGVDAPAIPPHDATIEDIEGKVVVGIRPLPLNLASRCKAVVEFPMACASDIELFEWNTSVERIKTIVGKPRIYTVKVAEVQFPRELNREVWP
jgi:hypothetical protein